MKTQVCKEIKPPNKFTTYNLLKRGIIKAYDYISYKLYGGKKLTPPEF